MTFKATLAGFIILAGLAVYFNAFAANQLVSNISIVSTSAGPATAVGFTFTSTSTPIQVGKLCAWQVNGADTGSNTIYLQAMDGTVMASSTIDMTGVSYLSAKCQALASPVSLATSTKYMLADAVPSGNNYKASADGSVTLDTSIGNFSSSAYEGVFGTITENSGSGYGVPSFELYISSGTSTATSTLDQFGFWGNVASSTMALATNNTSLINLALAVFFAFLVFYLILVIGAKYFKKLFALK